MTWTSAEVAIAVGWALNAILIAFAFAFTPFSFRLRRYVAYAIVILIFAALYQWKDADPLWDFELIATQSLIVNLAVMYFLKAWLIRRSSDLGYWMAINNYALAFFFVFAQLWLVWDGGALETHVHYLAYAILLWTINRVITALLDPAPDHPL